MSQVSIEPFDRVHLDQLLTLVAAEGWTEYADDPERTYRALTAPLRAARCEPLARIPPDTREPRNQRGPRRGERRAVRLSRFAARA
jgi:hypothetical protein